MSENSAPWSNDEIGPRDFCLSKISPASRPAIVPIANRGHNNYKVSIDSDDPLLLSASFAASFE